MRRLLLLAVLAALLGAAVPVAAHQPDSASTVQAPVADLREVIAATPPAQGLSWIAMVVAGMAALAFWRRPRHAVAVLLVIVAALLAFESGVHSTHHLGQDSSSCSVASISGQLSAAIGDPDVHAAPRDLPATAVTPCAAPVVVPASLPPDAGRAPPLPSA